MSATQWRRGPSQMEPARALLLRRTDYADADLIVTLFAEPLGVVKARARNARRSRKRFGGALEPFHTLLVELDSRSSSEFVSLQSASVAHPRVRLLASYERMRLAGRALTWTRSALPPRQPEPRLWQKLGDLLDGLDDDQRACEATESLLSYGLALLVELGWGPQLQACVRCGRSCGSTQTAMFSPSLGGLVCRACGGARYELHARIRTALLALVRGERPRLAEEDASLGIALVEESMHFHAGVTEERRGGAG